MPRHIAAFQWRTMRCLTSPERTTYSQQSLVQEAWPPTKPSETSRHHWPGLPAVHDHRTRQVGPHVQIQGKPLPRIGELAKVASKSMGSSQPGFRHPLKKGGPVSLNHPRREGGSVSEGTFLLSPVFSRGSRFSPKTNGATRVAAGFRDS